MKKFKDLKSGDAIYIIGLNMTRGILFTRTATFDHYIYEDEGSLDEYDNPEVTIRFKEETETGVKVELERQMATKEITTVGTEFYYFPDVQRAEVFLKATKEKVAELLSRIDRVYCDLWENKEKIDSRKAVNKSNEGYMIGDILYSISFMEPCIYAGDCTAIYGDGVSTRAVTNTSPQYRKATETEIGVFMRKCSETMESTTKKIYSKTLIDTMIKCGYQYNTDKKIFEKTNT